MNKVKVSGELIRNDNKVKSSSRVNTNRSDFNSLRKRELERSGTQPDKVSYTSPHDGLTPLIVGNVGRPTGYLCWGSLCMTHFRPKPIGYALCNISVT